MPPGAARNALIALMDLEGQDPWSGGLGPARESRARRGVTAYTISLASPEDDGGGDRPCASVR